MSLRFFFSVVLGIAAVHAQVGETHAALITASATATYTEDGVNDGPNTDVFTITNNLSSTPGVFITSITILLPANTIFDAGGDGTLGQNPARGFSPNAGSTVGDPTLTATPTVLDQATSLTLNFLGTTFGANEAYAFSIDVDNAVSSLTGGAGNADRRQVTAAEFAGATFQVSFSGLLSGTFTGNFATTADPTVANVTVTQTLDTAPLPEPGSMALAASGVAGLFWCGRSRRKGSRRLPAETAV